MRSHSSTVVAVLDAQEGLLPASAPANETPALDITRIPIRRNAAVAIGAVALVAAPALWMVGSAIARGRRVRRHDEYEEGERD
jgi:hypothetical protein